jgi:2-amino-4-hydroxy-6-hydroxymethyldihydropteridine diphosphokinase
VSGNRGPHRVVIALGSNVEPARNLPLSVRYLSELGRLLACSRVYESPPADGSDQPNYLNAAVLLETESSAEALCRELLPEIESRLGRVRDPRDKSAPRPIDLDLVLFDDQSLTIDHRVIPDPEIAERAFLAVPLAELDPDRRLPGIEATLAQLAAPHLCRGPLKLRPDVSIAHG